MDIPKRKNIKSRVITGEYAVKAKRATCRVGTSWGYHYVVVGGLANYDMEGLV
jgi:hypothetical protein